MRKTIETVKVENVGTGSVIDIKLMTWKGVFGDRKEGWFRHGKEISVTFKGDMVFIGATGRKFRSTSYVVLSDR